jgi:hypothetical protein
VDGRASGRGDPATLGDATVRSSRWATPTLPLPFPFRLDLHTTARAERLLRFLHHADNVASQHCHTTGHRPCAGMRRLSAAPHSRPRQGSSCTTWYFQVRSRGYPQQACNKIESCSDFCAFICTPRPASRSSPHIGQTTYQPHDAGRSVCRSYIFLAYTGLGWRGVGAWPAIETVSWRDTTPVLSVSFPLLGDRC